VNDAVSFLWRWELAGHPRDAEAWRMMYDFANSAFPRAGVAFSDMHIALAQVVAGNDAALEFTLLKAYLGADRPDDARRMASVRRPGSSGIPVAGLAAVH